MKPVKIKVQESGLLYRKDYTKNVILITIDDFVFKYHYMTVCSCCDDDKGQGSWEEKEFNWRCTYSRQAITGVGVHQDADSGTWGVRIYFQGNNDAIELNFEHGEQAYDLFKQLEELHIAYITGRQPELKEQ